MSYYRYHVFFCTNLREPGQGCCENYKATEAREYAKRRIKDLGIAGRGGVRINSAGCMDRCEAGPVVVVYPEGVWYSYVDQEDIDDIIEQHLINGQPVERLKV